MNDVFDQIANYCNAKKLNMHVISCFLCGAVKSFQKSKISNNNVDVHMIN